MKVSVIGSRSLLIKDLGKYLPEGTTEIISRGITPFDFRVMKYAKKHGIKLRLMRPNYGLFGARAPFFLDIEIYACCDRVLAFIGANPKGVRALLRLCKALGKEYDSYLYIKGKAYSCDPIPVEPTNFDIALAKVMYDRVISAHRK